MAGKHSRQSATEELPTEPGSVIAVGQWWFVLLRPYQEGLGPTWELLHLPAQYARSAVVLGMETGKPYAQETVEAEIEQEGSFRAISYPVPEEGRKVMVDALMSSMDCKLADHEGTIRLLRAWLDAETDAHKRTSAILEGTNWG